MGIINNKISLEIELFESKIKLFNWYIKELSLFKGKIKEDIEKTRELNGVYGIGIGY